MLLHLNRWELHRCVCCHVWCRRIRDWDRGWWIHGISRNGFSKRREMRKTGKQAFRFSTKLWQMRISIPKRKSKKKKNLVSFHQPTKIPSLTFVTHLAHWETFPFSQEDCAAIPNQTITRETVGKWFRRIKITASRPRWISPLHSGGNSNFIAVIIEEATEWKSQNKNVRQTIAQTPF